MLDILVRVEGLDDSLQYIIAMAVNSALGNRGRQGDVTVAIVDDAEIRRMNREYRGIDSPTDVLSFPAPEGFMLLSEPDAFLGDIAISVDRARLQADEYGHSIERELAFLTIHGMLHLLGFDHILKEDEEEMIALQDQILREMGCSR